MVVDPNLLVSTKEGLADGFTFGVIEGPKQLLIQAEAGRASCWTRCNGYTPPRNTVGIILTLDLVSQADWRVARLCFHETLVGIDVGVGFFSCLSPPCLVWVELRSDMRDLLIHLHKSLLFGIANAATSEERDSKRQLPSADMRTFNLADGESWEILKELGCCYPCGRLGPRKDEFFLKPWGFRRKT